MRLTWRHVWAARKRRMPMDVRSDSFFAQDDGMVTIQYPFETIPIPDNGRYRLHNEMDDCIVCDKCAKVCPVDCIEIEPIKATEEVGRASDGSPIRLYAAKFDIDMAKCCYCGLCTTVCPTECLTMTKTFDYSEVDIRDMVYHYANLTPEEAQEKQDLLEVFQKEKEALKAAKKPVGTEAAASPEEVPAKPRPAFRPGMKPPTAPEAPAPIPADEVPTEEKPAAKVPFRPSQKPKTEASEVPSDRPADPPTAKVPFRPGMKPKTGEVKDAASEVPAPEKSATQVPFKPSMKPKAAEVPQEPNAPAAKVPFKPSMKPKTGEVKDAAAEVPAPEVPAAKVPFKPSMKPKAAPPAAEEAPVVQAPQVPTEPTPEVPTEQPVAKVPFRPSMKPKAAEVPPKEVPAQPKTPEEVPAKEAPEEQTPERPAAKVPFRPSMKPKPKPPTE